MGTHCPQQIPIHGHFKQFLLMHQTTVGVVHDISSKNIEDFRNIITPLICLLINLLHTRSETLLQDHPHYG